MADKTKVIENLYMSAQYETLFDELLKYFKNNEEYYDILRISNRYADLQRNKDITPAADYDVAISKISKSLIPLMKKVGSKTRLMYQNKLLTIAKDEETYIFTWLSMSSFDEYIITFALSLAIIYWDSVENKLKTTKVLVDNTHLEAEEVFRLLDFKLASKIELVFKISEFQQNFVVFTVFQKKNPLVEAVINEVYKKGNLVTCMFLDFDLALFKLKNYEG